MNKENFKPLGDRVLVQVIESTETTSGGIFIPDSARDKPQQGKVIAAGPGRVDDNGQRMPMDVKEGDVVIYTKYGGTEVKFGQEELKILSARDILAVVAE